MYGTVARLQVTPGCEAQFEALSGEMAAAPMEGYIATYVYRMDENASELWMAVAFRDKASYQANAQRPEQHTRYEKMRALLASDPEWHDGEIIFPAG